MSSVPPLLTPTLPAAAPAAVAAEVVVLQLPPEAAVRLALLKQLEAMVVALKDGAAQLKTDLGSLQVKLPVPLPEGTRLTLQVGAVQPDGRPALKLASVDGRPVTQTMLAGRLPAALPAARPVVEMTTSGGGEPNLLATIVKPAAPGTGGPPVLLAGTAFPVRLELLASAPLPGTGVLPPAAAPQPASLPATQTGAPAPSPGIAPASAPASAAPPAPSQPTAAAPSPTPAPQTAQQGGALTTVPTASPALPQQLSGTVAPNTLAGQPLVQTDLGLVSLQGAPSLPAGARVMLQVTGPAVRTEPAATAQAMAGPWSGLSEAVGLLASSDPAAAARLSAALPQFGPRLAEGMVAFVAAAQNGVLRPVFGEKAAQALERAGRPEAAKRLLDDLERAEPQVRRDAGGEWRVMAMPMLDGAAVEPVRLFMRRPEWDGDQAGTAGVDKGQRFVVDVSLSTLGRLQIDGLVRRSVKRLDVLVRTAQPLPGTIRQDILRIFADCCSAAGIVGEAGFQVTPRFIEPAAETPPNGTAVVA